MTSTPLSPPPTAATPPDGQAPVEALTRATMRAVFKEMINLELADDEPRPLAIEDAGQIVGSVGFIGEATGVIHLYMGIGFAKTITSRMLALDEGEVEAEMLNDAIAELGNVVVGSVKSRLCDLGWPCTLTIPSVLRGHHLSVMSIADASRTVAGFRAGDQRMIVEMLLKNRPAEAKPMSLKTPAIAPS